MARLEADRARLVGELADLEHRKDAAHVTHRYFLRVGDTVAAARAHEDWTRLVMDAGRCGAEVWRLKDRLADANGWRAACARWAELKV
jgi:hypothetical protein